MDDKVNIGELVATMSIEGHIDEGDHIKDVVVIYQTENLVTGMTSVHSALSPQTETMMALGMITFTAARLTESYEHGDD